MLRVRRVVTRVFHSPIYGTMAISRPSRRSRTRSISTVCLREQRTAIWAPAVQTFTAERPQSVHRPDLYNGPLILMQVIPYKYELWIAPTFGDSWKINVRLRVARELPAAISFVRGRLRSLAHRCLLCLGASTIEAMDTAEACKTGCAY